MIISETVCPTKRSLQLLRLQGTFYIGVFLETVIDKIQFIMYNKAKQIEGA